MKGWQAYIVLAHLISAQKLKAPPEKAIEILPAFYETFGVQWGEHLGRSPFEVTSTLRGNGWLQRLADKDTTEQDITASVFEQDAR